MRSIRRRAAAGALAALLLGLAACGGGAAPAASAPTDAGPNGVDDGSTLTLWARDGLADFGEGIFHSYLGYAAWMRGDWPAEGT